MAQVIGDICTPTGKYVKDGEDKTSWAKCGILLKTDKGFRIKLDTVPVGGGEQGCWLQVFEKDNRQGQSQGSPTQRPSASSQDVGKDEDLPF